MKSRTRKPTKRQPAARSASTPSGSKSSSSVANLSVLPSRSKSHVPLESQAFSRSLAVSTSRSTTNSIATRQNFSTLATTRTPDGSLPLSSRHPSGTATQTVPRNNSIHIPHTNRTAHGKHHYPQQLEDASEPSSLAGQRQWLQRPSPAPGMHSTLADPSSLRSRGHGPHSLAPPRPKQSTGAIGGRAHLSNEFVKGLQASLHSFNHGRTFSTKRGASRKTGVRITRYSKQIKANDLYYDYLQRLKRTSELQIEYNKFNMKTLLPLHHRQRVPEIELKANEHRDPSFPGRVATFNVKEYTDALQPLKTTFFEGIEPKEEDLQLLRSLFEYLVSIHHEHFQSLFHSRQRQLKIVRTFYRQQVLLSDPDSAEKLQTGGINDAGKDITLEEVDEAIPEVIHPHHLNKLDTGLLEKLKRHQHDVTKIERLIHQKQFRTIFELREHLLELTDDEDLSPSGPPYKLLPDIENYYLKQRFYHVLQAPHLFYTTLNTSTLTIPTTNTIKDSALVLPPELHHHLAADRDRSSNPDDPLHNTTRVRVTLPVISYAYAFHSPKQLAYWPLYVDFLLLSRALFRLISDGTYELTQWEYELNNRYKGSVEFRAYFDLYLENIQQQQDDNPMLLFLYDNNITTLSLAYNTIQETKKSNPHSTEVRLCEELYAQYKQYYDIFASERDDYTRYKYMMLMEQYNYHRLMAFYTEMEKTGKPITPPPNTLGEDDDSSPSNTSEAVTDQFLLDNLRKMVPAIDDLPPGMDPTGGGARRTIEQGPIDKTYEILYDLQLDQYAKDIETLSSRPKAKEIMTTDDDMQLDSELLTLKENARDMLIEQHLRAGLLEQWLVTRANELIMDENKLLEPSDVEEDHGLDQAESDGAPKTPPGGAPKTPPGDASKTPPGDGGIDPDTQEPSKPFPRVTTTDGLLLEGEMARRYNTRGEEDQSHQQTSRTAAAGAGADTDEKQVIGISQKKEKTQEQLDAMSPEEREAYERKKHWSYKQRYLLDSKIEETRERIKARLIQEQKKMEMESAKQKLLLLEQQHRQYFEMIQDRYNSDHQAMEQQYNEDLSHIYDSLFQEDLFRRWQQQQLNILLLDNPEIPPDMVQVDEVFTKEAYLTYLGSIEEEMVSLERQVEDELNERVTPSRHDPQVARVVELTVEPGTEYTEDKTMGPAHHTILKERGDVQDDSAPTASDDATPQHTDAQLTELYYKQEKDKIKKEMQYDARLHRQLITKLRLKQKIALTVQENERLKKHIDMSIALRKKQREYRKMQLRVLRDSKRFGFKDQIGDDDRFVLYNGVVMTATRYNQLQSDQLSPGPVGAAAKAARGDGNKSGGGRRDPPPAKMSNEDLFKWMKDNAEQERIRQFEFIQREKKYSETIQSPFAGKISLSPSQSNQLFQSRMEHAKDNEEMLQLKHKRHLEPDFKDVNTDYFDIPTIEPPKRVSLPTHKFRVTWVDKIPFMLDDAKYRYRDFLAKRFRRTVTRYKMDEKAASVKDRFLGPLLRKKIVDKQPPPKLENELTPVMPDANKMIRGPLAPRTYTKLHAFYRYLKLGDPTFKTVDEIVRELEMFFGPAKLGRITELSKEYMTYEVIVTPAKQLARNEDTGEVEMQTSYRFKDFNTLFDAFALMQEHGVRQFTNPFKRDAIKSLTPMSSDFMPQTLDFSYLVPEGYDFRPQYDNMAWDDMQRNRKALIMETEINITQIKRQTSELDYVLTESFYPKLSVYKNLIAQLSLFNTQLDDLRQNIADLKRRQFLDNGGDDAVYIADYDYIYPLQPHDLRSELRPNAIMARLDPQGEVSKVGNVDNATYTMHIAKLTEAEHHLMNKVSDQHELVMNAKIEADDVYKQVFTMRNELERLCGETDQRFDHLAYLSLTSQETKKIQRPRCLRPHPLEVEFGYYLDSSPEVHDKYTEDVLDRLERLRDESFDGVDERKRLELMMQRRREYEDARARYFDVSAPSSSSQEPVTQPESSSKMTAASMAEALKAGEQTSSNSQQQQQQQQQYGQSTSSTTTASSSADQPLSSTHTDSQSRYQQQQQAPRAAPPHSGEDLNVPPPPNPSASGPNKPGALGNIFDSFHAMSKEEQHRLIYGDDPYAAPVETAPAPGPHGDDEKPQITEAEQRLKAQQAFLARFLPPVIPSNDGSVAAFNNLFTQGIQTDETRRYEELHGIDNPDSHLTAAERRARRVGEIFSSTATPKEPYNNNKYGIPKSELDKKLAKQKPTEDIDPDVVTIPSYEWHDGYDHLEQGKRRKQLIDYKDKIGRVRLGTTRYGLTVIEPAIHQYHDDLDPNPLPREAAPPHFYEYKHMHPDRIGYFISYYDAYRMRQKPESPFRMYPTQGPPILQRLTFYPNYTLTGNYINPPAMDPFEQAIDPSRPDVLSPKLNKRFRYYFKFFLYLFLRPTMMFYTSLTIVGLMYAVEGYAAMFAPDESEPWKMSNIYSLAKNTYLPMFPF